MDLPPPRHPTPELIMQALDLSRGQVRKSCPTRDVQGESSESVQLDPRQRLRKCP